MPLRVLGGPPVRGRPPLEDRTPPLWACGRRATAPRRARPTPN